MHVARVFVCLSTMVLLFLSLVFAGPDGALSTCRQVRARTFNVPIIFGNLDTFIAPIWYHRPKLLIFSSLCIMVVILCAFAIGLVMASWLLTKSSVSRHTTRRLWFVSASPSTMHVYFSTVLPIIFLGSSTTLTDWLKVAPVRSVGSNVGLLCGWYLINRFMHNLRILMVFMLK